MSSKLDDDVFTILTVTTNGLCRDGSPAPNDYTIEIEVDYGVFHAVVPRGSYRVKLSKPLEYHPSAKAIAREIGRAIRKFRVEGKIGGATQTTLQLAKPSPGAEERTTKMVALLREKNRRLSR